MKSVTEIRNLIVTRIQRFVSCFISEFSGFLQRNKYGVMGTLAFHMILLILLFSFKIHTQKEFLESEIVIDITPEIAQQIQQEEKDKIERDLVEKKTEINDRVDELLRSIAVNRNIQKSNTDPKQKVSDLIDEIKNNLDELGSDDLPGGNKELNEFKKDSLSRAEERDKQRLLDSLQSIEYNGPSSVYYSLKNRHKLYLPIPVFKCEGEGKIVVRIGVNRIGRVVEAKIVKEESGVQDECLFEAALDASRKTRFNTSNSSPLIQVGTITYNFVKQ